MLGILPVSVIDAQQSEDAAQASTVFPEQYHWGTTLIYHLYQYTVQQSS